MYYKSHLKAIIAVIVLAALDQLTKYFFAGKTYMASCIGIQYAENTGAAFGILQGWNLPLILISIAVLAFLAYFYFKERHKLDKTYRAKAKGSFERSEKTAFILIFAGTLGNLIDRVMLGYVRDFIAIGSWPNFNVADSLNVVGVLILVYVLVKRK
ncbi:MAG: signal peptidase II [Candidatus Nanoarchaeia archaeon]|nr:signal peptidase II [Candidatus Nanoarchaeia archaeon]